MTRVAPGSAAIFWDDLERPAAQAIEVAFARARIDNRVELTGDLDLPDDASDNDLLTALYLKYHYQCAEKILGDFAFVIRDNAHGKVYLARDFMGCQPIYYSRNDKGIFVADTMPHLLESAEVSRREDQSFIAAMLSYSFAHFERTSFAEVRKVPPGQFLVTDRRSHKLTSYWEPRAIQPRKWPSHEQCLTEFRALLRQAIRDRMPEEGAVGVHVSGGLDCSSIAIITAQERQDHGQAPPIAYTWYPPPMDELPEAELEEYERLDAVCAAMGVEPTYQVQTADNVRAVLDRDCRAAPICNASYNERLVLQDAQARGVNVIMSGFGGDEATSFDGRGYTFELALTGRWGKLIKMAEVGGFPPLRFCFQQLGLGLAHWFLPDAKVNRLQYELTGKGYSKIGVAWRLFAPAALTRKFEKSEKALRMHEETRNYLNRGIAGEVKPLPPISAVRYTTSKAARCNLLRWPGLITRLESWDCDAAEYGVKHVYPLLDRRIVEFVLSLPSSAFRDARWKRLFFRQAVDPILPPEVCWRHVKTDPARATQLIDAFRDIFRTLPMAIRRGLYTQRRVQMVDLERLAGDIERIGNQERNQIGKLVAAVEFLGAGRETPESSAQGEADHIPKGQQ